VSPEAWHIAEQATVLHKQAQQDNDPAKYERAHQLYQQYLAKNADTPDADLTYFDAELLFKLERYDQAARLYERVVTLAPKGKYLRDAAYAHVLATRNAIHADDREAPDAGVACNKPGPCDLPADVQRLLAAYDRYVAVAAPHDEPAVEYRRARTYYEYNQWAKAAPLFDAIVARHPDHELAVYSATLELDCWAMLKRQDEVRAAIARFKKSPLMRDENARQQIEQLEKALKKKP
jgi:tetratricopeptide (TPR) repeat protein